MRTEAPINVLSVDAVAKMAGWPYRRMLRHLQARDRELHGTLLVKTGKGKKTRYSTTVGALEQLHPQWFTRTSSLREEVAEQASKVEEHDIMVERAHKDIGILKLQVRTLEEAHERLELRVRSIEAKFKVHRGPLFLGFDTAGDF